VLLNELALTFHPCHCQGLAVQEHKLTTEMYRTHEWLSGVERQLVVIPINVCIHRRH